MLNRCEPLGPALRARVEEGHYARKQLLSRSAIVAWSHARRMRMALRLVAPYAGGRLLDYGCGDGTFLAHASPMFTHLLGIDPDVKQVDDCRRRFAGVSEIAFASVADAAGPKHDGRYDLVICMEVLEHCIEADVVRVLDDLGRLIAPRGAVIISVPVEIGPSLLGKQIVRAIAGWRRIGDYQYRERYTGGELLKMVVANSKTAIRRDPYPFGAGVCHMHKGFNWRKLRVALRERFDLRETRFSPLGLPGGMLASQTWFVCEPARPNGESNHVK